MEKNYTGKFRKICQAKNVGTINPSTATHLKHDQPNTAYCDNCQKCMNSGSMPMLTKVKNYFWIF